MRSLLGEHVITPEGSGNVDFNKIISLNSTAAYLWERIVGTEFDEPGMVGMLLEEYNVDRTVAEADVSNLVVSMREAGLLED